MQILTLTRMSSFRVRTRGRRQRISSAVGLPAAEHHRNIISDVHFIPNDLILTYGITRTHYSVKLNTRWRSDEESRGARENNYQTYRCIAYTIETLKYMLKLILGEKK